MKGESARNGSVEVKLQTIDQTSPFPVDIKEPSATPPAAVCATETIWKLNAPLGTKSESYDSRGESIDSGTVLYKNHIFSMCPWGTMRKL